MKKRTSPSGGASIFRKANLALLVVDLLLYGRHWGARPVGTGVINSACCTTGASAQSRRAPSSEGSNCASQITWIADNGPCRE